MSPRDGVPLIDGVGRNFRCLWLRFKRKHSIDIGTDYSYKETGLIYESRKTTKQKRKTKRTQQILCVFMVKIDQKSIPKSDETGIKISTATGTKNKPFTTR